jgi:hypothetical protein
VRSQGPFGRVEQSRRRVVKISLLWYMGSSLAPLRPPPPPPHSLSSQLRLWRTTLHLAATSFLAPLVSLVCNCLPYTTNFLPYERQRNPPHKRDLSASTRSRRAAALARHHRSWRPGRRRPSCTKITVRPCRTTRCVPSSRAETKSIERKRKRGRWRAWGGANKPAARRSTLLGLPALLPQE